MSVDSREFARVVDEARLMARDASQTLSSAHLLLGLFAVSNPAELVLRSRRVDEEAILSRIREMPKETTDVFDMLVIRARELASGTGTDPRALHILLAIARQKGCGAYDLLTRCGVATSDLAREALSYVVGPLPRRFTVRDQPDDAQASSPRAAATPAPAVRSQQPAAVERAAAPARRTTTAPPPRRNTVAPPSRAPSKVSTVTVPPPSDPGRASRIVAIKRLAEGLDETPAPFAISPDDYPYLASMGRNLTELAYAGRIDPVIGREREVEEALDVLGKRRSNNPILVGEPGVGKTAVVEGIAQRLVQAQAMTTNDASQRIIIELDVAGLVAGTHLRGSLSEKLNGIKDEVRKANGRILVFIDEIHTLVGAGQTGEGAQDAANDLKAALARGEFPCIGATTFTEFQKYFTQDPALERRFVPIRVDEPSVEETITILRGLTARYEQHHQVKFSDEAIVAAAQMSARYVHDRQLPDKAISALDHAGSRARREGQQFVSRDDIAKVVARMARVPEDRLLVSDAQRILNLEEELRRRVIGHDEIVGRVAHSIRRNFAGFSGQRPLASFIFLGPTGVGKTELARSLAEAVFGEDALLRIDMSEFSESHSVAKLIGAPPGYVGYSEGGQLTEGIRRRPASVVLLDEIEKAHRDSQQLILQALDEGHLTDGRGRRVDFTSSIIVLTTNLGAEVFSQKAERSMGFGLPAAGSKSGRAEKALASAREAFPIELWNRIEDRLVFAPLERSDLQRIAHLLVSKSSSRLFEEKRIRFELDDTAVDYLLDNGGYDQELGARPMRQAIARHIEAPLADKILKGEIQSPDRIRVVQRRGNLDFEHLTIIEPRPAGASART